MKIMASVYNGNMVKCPHCGAYVDYSSSDIRTEERGYGVATYDGETYNAKLITCPRCGKEIEVY